MLPFRLSAPFLTLFLLLSTLFLTSHSRAQSPPLDEDEIERLFEDSEEEDDEENEVNPDLDVQDSGGQVGEKKEVQNQQDVVRQRFQPWADYTHKCVYLALHQKTAYYVSFRTLEP